MHRLRLSYRWERQTSTPAHPAALGNPMMDVLQAVQDFGSISGAARGMGQSYRHLWGQLKRWEAELERPLVVWEKGQAATLTAFASKLLWAERLAQARFGPQIESLQSELHRCFSVAFDDSITHLALCASHDEGLSTLRQYTADHHGLHLDIAFQGSVDAAKALSMGQVGLAGLHLLLTPSPQAIHASTQIPAAQRPRLNQGIFAPLLNEKSHQLIGFATRQQGLLVAKGNPHGIHNLDDALLTHLRFAPRAVGTGTHLLLQELLEDLGCPEPIHWQSRPPETSHGAVAQAIASGVADVGLGIESAARAKGLDFVPLVQEHYFLVADQKALASAAMQTFLQVLRSPACQELINALPGYQTYHCGQLLPLHATLGWPASGLKNP
jgi:putative molybdopterin biosynthesis protein